MHLFTCQNVLLASLLHRHNLTIGRCHLLAQALYGNPDNLLLDEPTSNLDSLNEGVILKAVRAECKDKTVLLVSHRKSTMAAADISFSVESGRLS